MKNNKILIVAGGTGGHISPGIALYQVFKNQFETYFLTLERNKNYNEFIKKNIKSFLL
jgi:UDP-N-acetylglucosamine:LPS N-acetylglucosamine transferase